MIPRSTLAAHPTSRVQGRNVVAVASGKGGVGKTWFSVTLAHALARAGRRTVLFDGDLGLANVDIQLGLAPRHDLAQVVAGRIDLKDAVTAYEPGGFDIIAGQSGNGGLAGLPPDRVTALRDRLFVLARGYDHAVVDLGAGVDWAVRTFATAVGSCFVVTTDEPTAITDAYAFIKVLSASHRDTEFAIVVNLAPDPRAGRATYETLRKACETFLKLTPRLAGVIRRDPRVRESIRNQAGLLTRYPNTAAAEDVEAIAREIVARG
jgi:flagellar biosynthesis protein FlhG